MNAVIRNALVVLVIVAVGVVAASSQVPTQTPHTGTYNEPGTLGTSPSVSPDLLAYLAFLNAQESIRADAEVRERQAAIERHRNDMLARIRSAGMAQYEAEAARRRADFASEQTRLATEAEARVENAAAELAEIRRAAEEDAVQAAAEEVVTRVRAFKAEWDVVQETTVTAMALERSQDLANVEEARGMVRVSYSPDPAREARWIRASAWSAAEREVRERHDNDAHGRRPQSE